MTTLKKCAMFTDIHFGKKSNSEQHNQDCLNFIEWFCNNVKADPSIDHIAFLGDWHENRSSLNISTLDYSYRGAKMLNELGLPVFFIIGNHDLYHRHTREIHSVIPFHEFDNFTMISEPTVINTIKGKVLFSPYLFPHEYTDLKKHLNINVWMGHFEFKDFVVTGYNIKMPTGPDFREFKGPKFIFSGHFHKRQAEGNVVYIGNVFPMDFSDAGDTERGMAVYDHVNEKVDFIDWEQGPRYLKISLTDILDDNTVLPSNARIKCIVDVPLSYEEITLIKQNFSSKGTLREFIMEESNDVSAALTGTVTEIDPSKIELANIDELMIQMLSEIDTDHIDNDMLIEIYKNIQIKRS